MIKVSKTQTKITKVININPSIIASKISNKIVASPLAKATLYRVRNISLIIANINQKIASASISKVIYLNSPVQPEMSVNFYFTVSDLVNNKLTKYHGFNGTVDVSVFDDLNKEVEVSVDVSDPNRVTIDLGRLTVSNNWQIKIEK